MHWTPATCSIPTGVTGQHETSMSYSISDESSVQSLTSSWLRETRWKNPCPLKHKIASDKIFFFRERRLKGCGYGWSARRRPFQWFGHPYNPDNNCAQCEVEWRKKNRLRLGIASISLCLLQKALKMKLVEGIGLGKDDTAVSPRKRLADMRKIEKCGLLDGSMSPSSSSLKRFKALVPQTLPLQQQQSSAEASGPLAASAVKVYDRQSSYSIDSLLNNRDEQEVTTAIAPSTSSSLNSSLLSSLLHEDSSGLLMSSIRSISPKSTIPCRPIDLPLNPPTSYLLPVTMAVGSLSRFRVHTSPWFSYRCPSALSLPPSPHAFFQSTMSTVSSQPGSSLSSPADEVERYQIKPPDVMQSIQEDADDRPLNLTICRAREKS